MNETRYFTRKFSLQGIGTNETVLIEIMTTRTNAEINAIKQTYKSSKAFRINPVIYSCL